jgi:hypothetical protein
MTDAGRLVAAATAVFSIGAGVVHISAAADHENLPVMLAGFLVVGTLQGLLGGLLLWRRPDPLVLIAALGLMLGSIGMWLMSRTVGLPFLPGGHMEPIGFKDGVTVLFELATIPGLLLLMSPELPRLSLPSPKLATQSLAFVGAFAFALMVPALVLGGGEHHSHDEAVAMGIHEHGEEGEDGHDHGSGEAGDDMAAHEHDDSGSGDGHDHGSGDGASASLSQSGGHAEDGHDHGGSDSGTLELAGTPTGTEGGGHDHGSGGDTGGGSGGDGHDHGSDDGGGEGDGHEHGGGEEKGGGKKGHDHGGAPDGGAEEKDGHDHGTAPGDEGHGDGGHEDGGHGDGGHMTSPTTPPLVGIVTERLEAMVPKEVGTRETIKLQYGPFPLPPGADASQVGVDVAPANGFIVGAKPSMRYADGSEVMHEDRVHLHHAHLFRVDSDLANLASDGRPGYEWVFGTGDEQTLGSFDLISQADPRGHRYGVELRQGEPMLMIWMPMNMSDQPKLVYLEFEFEFVHGTRAQLKEATGSDFKPLEPVLYGQTFNVPKTGGLYAWPLDAQRVQSASPFSDSMLDPETFMTSEPTHGATPGVGDVWTAPSDGELIGAAGHGHEGIVNVTFSALGSESNPCPDDGDRFPGTTILESSASYPEGMFPTHLKMGTSQPGWRVQVRKGDRIAINGVYDTKTYAWPDQMSVVGIYYDPTVQVEDSLRCKPRLTDKPQAAQSEAMASVVSQLAKPGEVPAGLHHDMGPQPCVADGCNDYDAPPAPPGPHTNTIVVSDFTFSPGDLKRSPLMGGTTPSMGGAPVVKRGEKLTFLNLDYVRYGGTRHSVASCHGPCNGPDTMTYPNSDGLFYSGPMGYLALAETASSENQATPSWTLDTSSLEPGYHAYYCFQHRWMRGAFYVE